VRSINMHQSDNVIRVIVPSYMWEVGFEERDEKAKSRLESRGYKVTFGENLKAKEFHLGTASVEDRVKDLHAAYSDTNVKTVMAYSGGWTANEMLPLIDWGLIKSNPKPLIGMSDITVLIDAIYAKTGVVGLLGPNFGTLGYDTEWEYSLINLDLVLNHNFPFQLKPSQEWSAKEGEQRPTNWKVIQPGNAEGILIGGNLNTFHLLQGTEFQPRFDKPFILVAEDDDESGELTTKYFSRRLESILQLPGVRKNLRGIIIGRFLPTSNVEMEQLANVLESKHLGDIPIVANMDFGHTLPTMSLPIGGSLSMNVTSNNINIKLS
jgi:muramoyltetrapeptide carboxypeptidase